MLRRGLLVIRRIDFGPIASRRDQQAVNRKLAVILREAARHTMPAAEADMAARNAVLFPDPLFPFVHVARCIGSGAAIPLGWPWRAVLGDALFAPRQQLAAELVARQLGDAQAGPAVRAILVALGEVLLDLAPAWPAALRTGALAVLFISDPAADGASVSGQDIATLAHDLRILAGDAAFVAIWGRLRRKHQRAAPVLPLAIAACLAPAGRPVAQRRVALAAACLAEVARRIGPQSGAAPLLRALAVQADTQAAAVWDNTLFRQPMLVPEESMRAVVDALVASRQALPIEPSVTRQAAVPGEIGPGQTEPVSVCVEEDRYTPLSDQQSAFVPTGFAGIGYLAALMQRSFGDWLNRAEHLVQATGQALLVGILLREAMHPEEPVQAFLCSLGDLPEPHQRPLPFHLSLDMLPGFCGPIRIAAVASHKGWHMAILGRLTIACWNGRASLPVRRLLRNGSGLARTAPRPWSNEAMVASCELGLRRYLRQGPGLRMHQLLRRRGEIAHTPAHLDLSFDASVIDLAIRRWALDVSPGWCPWLWRVVTIHYDFGDSDAGAHDAG